MKPLYPQVDINELVAEEVIEKAKALPIGTLRTWSGKEFIKQSDGWHPVGGGPKEPAAPEEAQESAAPSNETEVLTQEKEALKEYQSGMNNSALGGYANINGYLRNGKPTFGTYTEEETKLVDRVAGLVSSAINKHPIDTPTSVFRGMKVKKDDVGTAHYLNLKVGDTFSDKGFTSATTSKTVANKFSEKLNRTDVQFSIEIQLKPGDKALPMDKYHKHSSEKEMLIDRNVKFRVVSLKESNGIKKMVLEILP